MNTFYTSSQSVPTITFPSTFSLCRALVVRPGTELHVIFVAGRLTWIGPHLKRSGKFFLLRNLLKNMHEGVKSFRYQFSSLRFLAVASHAASADLLYHSQFG
jgi:hypothetical protein